VKTIADFGIVFAAGGSSRRYGEQNKLFDTIDGIPVFIFSIADFACLCPPNCMVLVAPENQINQFRELLNQFLPHIDVRIVPGGYLRGESVLNGLNALPDTVKYVAVHDAARPLATAEILEECLAEARKFDGAIVGRPITDTIKRTSDGQTIDSTVDRSELWSVETPQIFELAKLRCAYETLANDEREFTDDASVMEACGYKLKLVHFLKSNLKITWPGDTIIAEAVIRYQRSGICRS